ncbi:uncharacterized protein LOC109133815 [Beta vulgaris subsp. vulgaris]|uniref:uncharacterized protein LOC109133815 n=1 Tax=Beta vulgaris subsp. vulgaris TaxID=3555 RepID=UPI0020369D28|nr:uncharacterized protein LOC109133815 [Beta vulgaris subsp. vulgaris]
MTRSMELKGRLTRIKRSDSQTMDGYLHEIKVIIDSLAVIQCPVSNEDLVQHTLFGLDYDSDYDHIVTTVLHYPFPLSFNDLRPKLLLHEQCIKCSKDGLDSSSHHALVVVQSPSSGSSNKNNSGDRNMERNNMNRGGNNGRNQNTLGNNNNNANRGRPNSMSNYSNLSSYSMPCLDNNTNDLSSTGSNSSSSS